MNAKVGDLEKVDIDGEDGALVINLTNLLGQATAPFRLATGPGGIDAELMAAAVVFGGTVMGEAIAFGLMDDSSEADMLKFLTSNWQAGIDAGKSKVARAKARRAEMETRQ